MQVVIVDEEKYREFEPINEMIVNRSGAKLQPEPKFVISGLVDDEEYLMKLRIELVDESRYTFRRNQWVPVSVCVKNAFYSKMGVAESRKESGATWHSRIVQFDKMRISREFGAMKRNMAYLEPGHKYIPILSIVNVSTGVSIDYRFDLLQFIAVKSYQSIPVRHAKKANLVCPLLPSSPIEEEKPASLLSLKLLPQESQQQVVQWQPAYSYGGYGMTEIPYHPPPQNAYPFDYFVPYPQLQYPIQHAIQYPVPFTPIQYAPIKRQMIQQLIQEEQQEEVEIDENEDVYIPEYGWNPILVPGCKTEHIYEIGHHLLGFHHDIWAPQDMELENLYYRTEQNYHPLEMN